MLLASRSLPLLLPFLITLKVSLLRIYGHKSKQSWTPVCANDCFYLLCVVGEHTINYLKW